MAFILADPVQAAVYSTLEVCGVTFQRLEVDELCAHEIVAIFIDRIPIVERSDVGLVYRGDKLAERG